MDVGIWIVAVGKPDRERIPTVFVLTRDTTILKETPQESMKTWTNQFKNYAEMSTTMQIAPVSLSQRLKNIHRTLTQEIV